VYKEHINFYLKDDEYGWLSNFYPSPFIHSGSGLYFPTVEHFYQAMKTTDYQIMFWISLAPKPYLAMKIGRNLREKDGLKDNWEERKVEIMLEGLREKFRIHRNLRAKLFNTGDAILHENSPSDKFWGKRGRDQLGKCLMEVRQEIRNGILNG
jgi:ribA/ribD-fused uncharacterized protein